MLEELDYRATPLGELTLRRRSEPRAGNVVVYEVKLGDEFLMSSLFTVGERALATLGVAALDAVEADVVVGGLGLGYTALAALELPLVRSVRVVEVMDAVIDWHRRGILPVGTAVAAEPRCSLLHGDFFALAGSDGFYPEAPGRLAHAVLLDIDHSPRHWLNAANESFYRAPALARLAAKIHPGGIFGLWSNDRPDVEFVALLETVFASVEAEVVSFPNPYSGAESASTVYLARVAG